MTAPNAAEREYAFKQFGLTDDETFLEAARDFRFAALADGWVAKDDTGEHFEKEGFNLHVLSRICKPGSNRYRYMASVHIWGPDRLAIFPPDVYDWETIKARVRTCNYCGASDVDTQRISFAGRSCAKCIPGLTPRP